MTATQALPAETGRRYRFSILRILICGVFLSVLVAACLYCKYTAIDFFHARLLEQESKTSAWILKQVSFALPWIVMCIFQGLVYCKHDRHDGIVQREMFWEVLLVTVFTYLVLLPYLSHVSEEMYAAALEMGADIPQTDGKVDKTFLMIFHEWFIRMAVPLSALLLFHSIRARREKNHPETEVTEPLMTRAEYDAMKLAEMAEAETAFEAQSEKAMEIQAETAPEAQEEVTPEARPDEAVPQPETEVSHHE
jgi:hypothetical protein